MEKELEEWHKLHKFHFYSGGFETKDLASFLGVSPRTIQRWLEEKTKPNKKMLYQIKRYLEEKGSKVTL